MASETTTHKRMPRAVRLQVAAAAEVDPRTVDNYLDALDVRPASRKAIEGALRDLGHGTHIRGGVAA